MLNYSIWEAHITCHPARYCSTHPARHPTRLATPPAPVASKKKCQRLKITCSESPLQPQTGKVNNIKARENKWMQLAALP